MFCIIVHSSLIAQQLLPVIDTTSATATFLLYHMATNPDKQDILFSEIRRGCVYPSYGIIVMDL
jgi:hypothetical protein